MPNKIVYDLETKRAFSEVENRNPEKLGVSLVVVYDYSDNQYKTFREDNLKQMWPLFEKADLIIGFNQKHFDNRVLASYYAGDLATFPNLDLLEEFYKATNFRIRLNNLAQANLGQEKTADGLQAIRWYKEGNWQDLEKYCKQDVKVTKEIYEYALKNKKLKYKEINEIKETPINTKDWNKITGQAVNYTLPF